MSLQIPARSGTLRRLLLLGGGVGLPRPYSTGDRRRRVIREAQQEEEDEAFLRTLNFGADPENNPLPPPPRHGRGSPDAPPSVGAAANQQQQQQPERSAQKTAPSGGSLRVEPPPPQQPEDVDEIFQKMKQTGLIPNAVAMLDGLCKNGLVQDAMKLFGLMREKGAIPEVVIYTAVVDAFCKAAKLDDAVRIFRKMQGNGVIPNAFSYWLLIQGLCRGGRLDDAVAFCVEMFESGLSPNAETFVGLVDAVCKSNGVDEGEKLVRSFRDRNFAIDEKSIRDHMDRKGPFSPVVREASDRYCALTAHCLCIGKENCSSIVTQSFSEALFACIIWDVCFYVHFMCWPQLRFSNICFCSSKSSSSPNFLFGSSVQDGVFDLWKFHGLVKMSGIVLCSVGVVVLGLYQGPELKSFIHYHHFHYTSHDDANSSRKWILGTFLQSLAAVMWALWAILQGYLSQEYPSKLFNITLQIAFASAQSFFMTLVIERDFSRWKLHLDVGLAAILYCVSFLKTIVSNISTLNRNKGVTFAMSCYLQIWLLGKRGPVFLNMTVPLTLVFTILITFLMGEAVTLGRFVSCDNLAA
ncbi:hypothetical protein PR202_ga10823 [Eleusine coracana subsp. coracana]|uniref:Pentatricopeptide repeat-containing protein n=1 Tax=Eleusine coracana subsp. coracana TaxID=191504 RepID=A0AAV5C7L1_ELECO|nr:hypothetical protein PR202_ga10823 [Eleusine coracana subsp. coracana]